MTTVAVSPGRYRKRRTQHWTHPILFILPSRLSGWSSWRMSSSSSSLNRHSQLSFHVIDGLATSSASASSAALTTFFQHWNRVPVVLSAPLSGLLLRLVVRPAAQPELAAAYVVFWTTSSPMACGWPQRSGGAWKKRRKSSRGTLSPGNGQLMRRMTRMTTFRASRGAELAPLVVREEPIMGTMSAEVCGVRIEISEGADAEASDAQASGRARGALGLRRWRLPTDC